MGDPLNVCCLSHTILEGGSFLNLVTLYTNLIRIVLSEKVWVQ